MLADIVTKILNALDRGLEVGLRAKRVERGAGVFVWDWDWQARELPAVVPPRSVGHRGADA